MTEKILPNQFPVYVTGSPDAPHALIVIQEAFGVNNHIRSVADRFADAGYFVVAPELFHRVGSPEVPYDDFPSAMKYMGGLNREGLTNDLNATTDFLATMGYDAPNTGVVGYCMGGAVSFYAATLGTVGAAASFYGGGVETGRFGLPSLLELAPSLKCPWLGLYGDLDSGIPVEQVEALRRATAPLAVATQVVRYADAGHGFNCDARPAAFNAEASADATRRTLDFFATHLAAK
jgi:carboxymethylenebutenolidase